MPLEFIIILLVYHFVKLNLFYDDIVVSIMFYVTLFILVNSDVREYLNYNYKFIYY